MTFVSGWTIKKEPKKLPSMTSEEYALWLIKNEMYSCHGCSATDKIYCVVKDDKLYRLTFAMDLAKHMVKLLGDGYKVGLIKFKTGRVVPKGAKSESGLYAIVSNSNHMVLRIATKQDLAELLCDYESRYVRECWLLTESLKTLE